MWVVSYRLTLTWVVGKAENRVLSSDKTMLFHSPSCRSRAIEATQRLKHLIESLPILKTMSAPELLYVEGSWG